MHFNAPKSAYPYSLALPFLNRLEKRKSKTLFLLAPSHLGKQGLPSELQQRPWPLPHGLAHFSSTVFFHVSPDRSLTWHQHPWLNPLPFWAQNYLINRNWTYVKVLCLERILFLLYTKKACFWFVRQVSFTQACSTCTQLILFSACLQSACRSTSIWSGLYS